MTLRWMLMLGLCWTMQAAAEIYKWRDEKGIMNYSDTPPVAGPSTQKIKATTVPADTPLTRSDAYSREQMNPAKQKMPENSAGQNASPEAEALKAMEARQKAQNCAAARSNYRNYAVGGRMQNVNENGQREYLSDEQIRQGLAAAQQEIDENCPPE
ncbi:DUF4124 domain-containing protein [Methylophilus sp. 13]|uniref:DUF4124 domain-containing protein n=1 Tax=Methylophilus sp. 13 TaxID=2781018 RepID=UPI001E333825|nr:DUF4124 domain-containing protein [Methylophilus sp. 13]